MPVERAAAQGPIAAEEHALLLALAPHIRRAARLTVELGAARLRADAADAALDRLALGVAILDAAGRLQFANLALRAMAAERDGIMIAAGEAPWGGGLRFGHRVAQTAVQRMIAGAIATAQNRAIGAGGTARVTRPSGRRPYQVTVSPLPGNEPIFVGASPAVVVLVSDPERAPAVPAEILRALYRLTPREAELALALAGGETFKTVAERLGIVEGTARVHLSAVFHKTGTRRQVDLMRLLLRMLPG